MNTESCSNIMMDRVFHWNDYRPPSRSRTHRHMSILSEKGEGEGLNRFAENFTLLWDRD